MARTLPTRITDYLTDAEIYPVYLVIIDYYGTVSADTNFGLVAGSNLWTDPSQFFWKSIDMPSPAFDSYKKGLIAKLSRISEQLKISNGGGVSVVSDFSLEIFNSQTSNFDTLVNSTIGMPLEQRPISLYLSFYNSISANTDPATISDALLLSSGRISKTGYDTEKYQIQARDDRIYWNDPQINDTATDSLFNTSNTSRDAWIFAKQIDSTEGKVVDSDTAPTDAIIPDRSLNEPIKLVYGNYLKAKGTLTNIIPKGVTNVLGQTVLFSDESYPCKSGGDVYVFEPRFNDQYLKIATNDGTGASEPDLLEYEWDTITSTESFIDFNRDSDNDFAREGVVYISSVVLVNSWVDDNNEGTEYDNPENAFDGDIETYATIKTYDYAVTTPNTYLIDYRLPIFSVSNSENATVHVYPIIKVILQGSFPFGGNSDFRIQIIENDGSTVSESNIILDSTNTFNNIDGSQTAWEEPFVVGIPDAAIDTVNKLFSAGSVGRIFRCNSFTNNTADIMPDIYLYEMSFRIEFTLGMLDALFLADMEGIKAPSADYNAGNGNLLENPQDIARHLIEAVNGDKDQTIAELNKICMQSHSVLFVDFNNEWKMVSLSAGTSAMTITSGDIRSDANGRPTTGINAVTLTPLSELYNEFTINYNWDNGQERFLNELYIRDDGTSTVTTPSFVSSPASLGGYATLCGTSYQNYNGYKNRLIIDADWINDDATAELLLIELVTFFKDRKHVVNIETKNDFTVGASDYSLELELGDQVLINWADYLPTGVTNSALFMLFKNDFITYQNNNCYQKLSFLEIPAALEVGAYSNGYSDGYENQGS